MSGVKIKICGLTRPEDVDAVNGAGPDYCGFVIGVPKSRRNTAPDQVRALRARLASGILAVGVFVDAAAELVLELLEDGTLDLAQLHGGEDGAYIQALKARTDRPVIKAFSVSRREDVLRAAESPADYILLDHGAGGTGAAFDWALAEGLTRPFFLAGGLGPDNAAEAIRRAGPFAVDMSSGVETGGRKDRAKIWAAVAAVRRCDP